MRSLLFYFTLASLLFGAAGCSVQAQSTAAPTPSGDVIATAVAGTLAASSAKTATFDAVVQQTALAVTPSATPTLVNTPAATATAAETPTQAPEAVLSQGRVPTVAFVGAGNNVWVWRGGQARQLTNTGDVAEVAVSDDGLWVAFTRSTDFLHYTLWAIDVNSKGERALMDSAAFAGLPLPPGAVSVVPVMFNWVPGLHTVAFTTRPIFEGPGLMMNDDLWLVDADTLQRKQLLAAGQGGKFYYSPDGKQIALARNNAISLVNADGSNRRDVLSFPVVSTYSEYYYYPIPIWLPDGSGLRVVIPPQASLEHPEESTAVWEITLKNAAARKIGSVLTAPLMFPQLSPDGSKIAYLKPVGQASANRSDLHIANADGTADTLYATEALPTFVSWSPDAQHFFFTVGSTNRPFIGSPGAEPQLFAGVTTATEVRWTDATHFLFVTRSSGADNSGTTTGGNVELRQGDLSGSSQALASFSSEEGRPLLYDFNQQRP